MSEYFDFDQGDNFLPSWGDDMAFNPWDSQDMDVVGTPEQDANYWHEQGTPFTCAVVSQQTILNEFGVDVSESQLVYDATTNGWLTDAGTSSGDMGELLDYYGIETHTNLDANISDVITELSQGHKVIVAVDSGEIWGTDSLFENLFDQNEGADHAIVITGVDVSDPDHPMVYVNDSGDPNGAGKAYPMDQFVDAWSDSGFRYVATNNAPENIGDSLLGANFNSETGMYLDSDFWNTIGGYVVDGVDIGGRAGFATLSVTGSPELATIVGTAVAGISAFVDTFEFLSDAQRNDLFMTI